MLQNCTLKHSQNRDHVNENVKNPPLIPSIKSSLSQSLCILKPFILIILFNKSRFRLNFVLNTMCCVLCRRILRQNKFYFSRNFHHNLLFFFTFDVIYSFFMCIPSIRFVYARQNFGTIKSILWLIFNQNAVIFSCNFFWKIYEKEIFWFVYTISFHFFKIIAIQL